jgi:hypothetical protein
MRTMNTAETDGWAALDPHDPDDVERRRAALIERYRVDTLFARVFGTTEGAELLHLLRGQTIEQPAWVPGQDSSHGFAREGQNSLVREIERRIARARLGPPPEINKENAI